jgi:ATP-dependent Clp protease adaptor protein ClpS
MAEKEKSAGSSAIKEKPKEKTKEPKQYQVIMLNDDFTTMEFVVEILMDIFGKDMKSATELMLLVHRTGRAAVGIYPYDIASSKVEKALARAKQNGFPFRMLVEEA